MNSIANASAAQGANLNALQPLQHQGENFRLDFSLIEQRPVVTCTGRISTAAPAVELNPFFDEVHKRLAAAGATEVRIDIRNLEFLNSSGFKCFIHWVGEINKLPAAQHYRLRFFGATKHGWQRSGMPALRVFAVHLIEYTLV